LPTLQETAYPRLKSSVSARDLATLYTPTAEELALAQQATRGAAALLGFLVLLKTFQRLGYFVLISQVPGAIVEHVARITQTEGALPDLPGYDASGTRVRHLHVIREHLQVRPCDHAARRSMLQAMHEAARTKEHLADLVNVGIEALVRQRYELPAFDTLVRAARQVRVTLYRQFYRQVDGALTAEEKAALQGLLVPEPETHFTPWNQLKQEPGHPSLTQLRRWLERQDWLAQYRIRDKVLAGIPDVKVQHFAAEAKTLDAARMLAVEPQKRFTLAVSLLTVQAASVLDDLAEMLLKRMAALHQRGREALETYRAVHRQRTDELVLTLRDLVTAYRSDGSAPEKLAAMEALLPDAGAAVLQRCEDHLAHAGDHYFPFLWRFYKSHRATLFRLLRSLPVKATSQDTAFEEALQFLLTQERRTGDWLPLPSAEGVATRPLDLSWMPENWWLLVTGQRGREKAPPRLNRRYFEICVFSQLVTDLKAGDLCLPGSHRFADYREQLLSWEEYRQQVAAYGEMVGFPVEGEAFVAHMQARLTRTAQETDQAFPENHHVRIENGEPVLRRPKKAPPPAGLATLEATLATRLEPAHLLEILRDTEHWLQWTRFFGPISGHDAKLEARSSRYLATVFCYGCHLGPTQTARSLGHVDRRQLAWINLRHLTEERLDRAIREVINAYHRFTLPKRWGSGKHASADGTKWDLYEQNLLAEYHIRYGGYGGIGYYHVSDTYIALFSHFIPCGVWEAVYILDGLLKNQADLQPDTLHADTQGQSAPVFGLALLLGISLMPRIRNWKDLTLLRPDGATSFPHLDPIFSGTVDWHLIRTHLPDLLRVVLSIKAGRITASTLLRRLGTYSRKNRLYQAFRELGRAVRTEFLLQYLGSAELRALIQAATNKSEAFNGFAQWVAFGGDGTITQNDREEQRKVIKYNHLVANCVIFHNVFTLSRLLAGLQKESFALEPEAIAALSPYLTQHINRFGNYQLDMEQRPPELVYDFGI
jgi:TnpA family transposase